MTARQLVAETIRRGQRFLLTCHLSPDVDAMGSMLGLAALLRRLDKEVVLYHPEPVPKRLAFLWGSGGIVTKVPAGQVFDATLVTDTAARNLLQVEWPAPEVTGPVVMLDHHRVHDDFGDIVFRDVQACATAMVIRELAQELGFVQLPKAAALPLYAALVADTGGFRYSGTTATTLRVAADLVDAGVDPAQVAREVFENWSRARMRLLGQVIADMESLAEGRITLSAMELSTIEELGASDRLMAGMVDYGRMLEGVEVAISLWEQRCNLADGGDSEAVRIKLSLRSTGRVDVAAVAKQLGGGGHRLAAGASLTCGLQDAVQQVVALVCAALAEV